ncbi:MAG: hypothetical protein WB729_13260, partial [Candidatus Sulfotelmatobacter sp.]
AKDLPPDQGLGHVRCLRPLVKTRAFGMTPLVDGRNFQTEPLPEGLEAGLRKVTKVTQRFRSPAQNPTLTL